MKRLPLVPTIVVSLAVAAMIGLGLWQLLDRLPMKERFIAELAANPARPAVPFPTSPDDTLLFRRTTASCRQAVSQQLAGAGAAGYRLIARCRTGPGAAEMIVQLGTTRDPHFRSSWSGGPLRGYISHAPSGVSLIGSLFDRRPPDMMLVADTPPPGLAANAPPDVGAVPNNHLSYAVQWFFFAAIAAVIYLLAASKRVRAQEPGRRTGG